MNSPSSRKPSSLFRVKICGVTRVDDVLSVSAAGADGIGFNFYERSPRCVSSVQAGELAAVCGASVQRVGVFVNATRETILDCVLRGKLDWIQFHGDESPEFVSSFAEYRLIRAFRCGTEGLAPVLRYLDRLTPPARAQIAVLLDAAQPGQYGGTGQTLDWVGLSREVASLGETPWILAGGLTPANIAEAVECLRPAAVDTASGVESAPGIKDPLAVQQFCQRAAAAFARP